MAPAASSGSEGATRPPAPGRRIPATTTLVAVVAVLLATVLAFHYTLGSLLSGLTLDTPLAYLGLVPFLALGLALLLVRRPDDDHDIHDRQVDLLVGVPLVGASVAALLLLPDRLGSTYWQWRLDVLTLPLFAAGLVVVLLGTRLAWRLRAPLLLLLVAWPVPWTALLERIDAPLLATTSRAVRAVASAVPVATPVASTTDAVFRVPHAGSSFVVTVASACAGASSTLGVLLLGSAGLLVARGPRRGKLLWLAAGVALAWLGNVLRIVALLLAGRWAGQGFALDVLHPVLGTIIFAVTSVVMVLLLPRFGLRLPNAQPRPRPASAGAVGLAASSRASRAVLVGVLAVAAVAAAGADGALSHNEDIVSPFGQARLQAFTTQPAVLQGWRIGDAGTYPQAARYFGGGATWRRLLYQSPSTLAGTSIGALPVSVDVIRTGSSRALNAYSVAACYAFHRFDVSSHSKPDLGAGLKGELFTYYNKHDRKNWNALAWQWPVRDGARSAYERVVLILVDVPGVPLPAVDGAPQAGTVSESTARRLHDERAFLKGFARSMVARALLSAGGQKA